MTDKINDLLKRVAEFAPEAAAEVEEFRIKILGKKGELSSNAWPPSKSANWDRNSMR